MIMIDQITIIIPIIIINRSIPNNGMPQYPQRYMNNQCIPIDIPQMQHVIPNNMYPQYQYISTPAMQPQPDASNTIEYIQTKIKTINLKT